MNLIEVQKELYDCSEAGMCVLLRSPSGFGKSSVVMDFVRKVVAANPDKSVGWGIKFLATKTPVDLNGYTFMGTKKFPTELVPDPEPTPVDVSTCPHWMLSMEGKPAWMYDKYILIFEEYGQAEPDMKKAAAEILLNGGTDQWHLPQDNVRIAISNESVRDGVTKDFDFNIARRTVIDIDPSVDVWLHWADQPYYFNGRPWQTLPVTKSFAVGHPEILFEAVPAKQGPWCNPRTLASFDRYLQVKAKNNNGSIPADNAVLGVASGTIGAPAASQFITHLQFRTELPQYADVVADPTGTPVPTKPDLQMMMAYELAHQTQKKDLGAVLEYIQRKEYPKDMQITFGTALLRRDFKNLVNEPAMDAWIGKNATLINVVSALSN